MNTADIILIMLIAAALIFAVRTVIRNKKQGRSCCGDCSACGGCQKKQI